MLVSVLVSRVCRRNTGEFMDLLFSCFQVIVSEHWRLTNVVPPRPGAVAEFSELLDSHIEAANCKVPMGLLSEQMAKDRNVTRAEQDAFAALSYQKAIKAQELGLFNEEIVPLMVKFTDPKTNQES